MEGARSPELRLHRSAHYLRPVTRCVKVHLSARAVELSIEKLFVEPRGVGGATGGACGGGSQCDDTIIRVGSDGERGATEEAVDGRRIEDVVGAVRRCGRLPIQRVRSQMRIGEHAFLDARAGPPSHVIIALHGCESGRCHTSHACVKRAKPAVTCGET